MHQGCEGEERYLQSVEDLWWSKYFSAGHGEDHNREHIHTAPHGEPILEEAPGRNSDPCRGAYAEADFLVGAVVRGQFTLEQSAPEGLQNMERTHTGAVEKHEEEVVTERRY